MEDRLCESCKANLFKYRCPSCGCKSCSVECVKQHKITRRCNGMRCKTGFVSLDSFTDNNLLSDYYFLEDVARLVDSASRSYETFSQECSDTKKRRTSLYWLHDHARKRGIRLDLLPPGMHRHVINTSRTLKDKSTKKWKIHWRVHLIFPECDTSFEKASVSEDTLLSALLECYIHPTQSDPVARYKLQSYVAAGGVEGVEVWLEGSGFTVHQCLDTTSTLRDNFSNKTIAEFPVLHILSKGAGPPKLKRSLPPEKSDEKKNVAEHSCCHQNSQVQAGEGCLDSPEDTRPSSSSNSCSSLCGKMNDLLEDGELVEKEEDTTHVSSLALIADLYGEESSEEETD